jgi:hypothetical protein
MGFKEYYCIFIKVYYISKHTSKFNTNIRKASNNNNSSKKSNNSRNGSRGSTNASKRCKGHCQSPYNNNNNNNAS